jgi:UDP-glucose 4-epimerase
LSDWFNGDVTHANLDGLAVKHGVPECVIHLAGGSAVGPSFAAPAEDFRRSVVGTAELAEWMRLHALLAPVVMASSAAVYGAGHSGQISEQVTCGPYSPYGHHKHMAELALASYAHSFGLKVACVRFFSVYGPGLRKQLLWDACTKLGQNVNELALGGSGNELRDWLHVADAAQLLHKAIGFANANCPIVNGGTGTATPVRAVAEHLLACWGSQAGLTFSGVARSGDPQSLVADPSLAHQWRWSAQHTWQAGLAEFVDWFKANDKAGAL